MNIGMLWFDNDPKADLLNKIQRAADYYLKKYGQAPDLCFIHPSMLGERAKPAGRIEVRLNPAILPDHFWIGIHTVPTAG